MAAERPSFNRFPSHLLEINQLTEWLRNCGVEIVWSNRGPIAIEIEEGSQVVRKLHCKCGRRTRIEFPLSTDPLIQNKEGKVLSMACHHNDTENHNESLRKIQSAA